MPTDHGTNRETTARMASAHEDNGKRTMASKIIQMLDRRKKSIRQQSMAVIGKPVNLKYEIQDAVPRRNPFCKIKSIAFDPVGYTT